MAQTLRSHKANLKNNPDAKDLRTRISGRVFGAGLGGSTPCAARRTSHCSRLDPPGAAWVTATSMLSRTSAPRTDVQPLASSPPPHPKGNRPPPLLLCLGLTFRMGKNWEIHTHIFKNLAEISFFPFIVYSKPIRNPM